MRQINRHLPIEWQVSSQFSLLWPFVDQEAMAPPSWGVGGRPLLASSVSPVPQGTITALLFSPCTLFTHDLIHFYGHECHLYVDNSKNHLQPRPDTSTWISNTHLTLSMSETKLNLSMSLNNLLLPIGQAQQIALNPLIYSSYSRQKPGTSLNNCPSCIA